MIRWIPAPLSWSVNAVDLAQYFHTCADLAQPEEKTKEDAR